MWYFVARHRTKKNIHFCWIEERNGVKGHKYPLPFKSGSTSPISYLSFCYLLGNRWRTWAGRQTEVQLAMRRCTDPSLAFPILLDLAAPTWSLLWNQSVFWLLFCDKQLAYKIIDFDIWKLLAKWSSLTLWTCQTRWTRLVRPTCVTRLDRPTQWSNQSTLCRCRFWVVYLDTCD